jgi:hypothetical protein
MQQINIYRSHGDEMAVLVILLCCPAMAEDLPLHEPGQCNVKKTNSKAHNVKRNAPPKCLPCCQFHKIWGWGDDFSESPKTIRMTFLRTLLGWTLRLCATFLETLTVAQLMKKFPAYTEPKDSLQCSPMPPIPDESIPTFILHFLKINSH